MLQAAVGWQVVVSLPGGVAAAVVILVLAAVGVSVGTGLVEVAEWAAVVAAGRVGGC